jgi:hypothetical protein
MIAKKTFLTRPAAALLLATLIAARRVSQAVGVALPAGPAA